MFPKNPLHRSCKIFAMSLWNICFFLALICFSGLFFFSGPDTFNEDLGEILFGFIVGVLIVLVALSNYTLQYLREIRKVIGIEGRLLDAVSRDFQEAYRSVEQIEGRANQVWESEALKLRGITQRLSEGEMKWVKETGELSFEARRCTEEYERGSESRGLLEFMKPILTFNGPSKEVDLAFAMRRANRAIREYLEARGRACVRNSVILLEESRGRVRRLRDRPIDDTNIEPPKQPLPSGVSSVLERLVVTNPNMTHGAERSIRSVVIQLNLLRALMKDLKGVRLESQVEKVWLQGAQEIVDQAHRVIGVFLQEAASQVRWLSRMSDYWRYGPKLNKVMKNVGELLANLLEAKERYGFNFVVRGLSKDAILNLHHREDDGGSGAISSFVIDIRRKLVEQETEGHTTSRGRSVVELLEKLQNLEKVLKEREETEGAVKTRKACYGLLKKLLIDLSGCVENPRSDRIDQIRRDAYLLEKCFKVYRIKVMDESCSVVGLKEDIHKLVHELTAVNPDEVSDGRRPLVIAIVGMRGVGKKTLAKEICNHQSIANSFPFRPLVTVPNSSDPIVLLRSVATQIMKTQETRTERDVLINKLSSFLKVHKTLVVLDGLLSMDSWDSLAPALVPKGSVSAVVVITRDKEIAFHVNPSSVHRHRLRTAKESWEFFTQMVNCSSDPEAVKLAKRVVERTGGLPLAILRLGYLLSEEIVTKDELSVLLERISQGQNQSPWEDNLTTNKRDFQSQPAIECCLSYFQLFPKDYEIPVRRLVAVWVARGIAPNHGLENANEPEPRKTQERVAYECLLDLIDRNMVQAVERKHNKKVLTCRFPNILKEIWLRGRRQIGTTRSWSLCASSDRQVAYRFDHNEDGSESRTIQSLHSNVLREDNRPLSVTFLDSREGSGPGEDVCNFIVRAIGSGNFRGLLVLDLELIFKPILPDNIGKLKQLKYLGLRWTYIDKLPDSVGQLSELQTLDLKQTALQSLPSSIWKLKKLQRLHLDHNFRIKDMPNPSDISMKNLHKLSGGFVDYEGKALLESLHKLSSLRKLRLSFELKPEEQETLSKKILQLKHLQSLSLRSVNVSNESQDLKLMHLAPLEQLSSLYLLGKIDNMCIISELPRSLTELTLSASEFSRGHLLLEMLAELPELEYLSFFSRSYVDKELVFVGGGFRKLLVLKLWALERLESLKVEEGAMPIIREFEIRECRNLKVTNPDYSTGLTRLRTLQELKFTDMSREYVSFVEKEFAKAKRQDLEESVHFPIIKIKNYDNEASNM